ncbi:hypothetical protein J6590_027186 [Homalodisca vitripennis]|nr:hypothetical protein J6590_027186 [Homalodisca vitripennis]
MPKNDKHLQLIILIDCSHIAATSPPRGARSQPTSPVSIAVAVANSFLRVQTIHLRASYGEFITASSCRDDHSWSAGQSLQTDVHAANRRLLLAFGLLPRYVMRIAITCYCDPAYPDAPRIGWVFTPRRSKVKRDSPQSRRRLHMSAPTNTIRNNNKNQGAIMRCAAMCTKWRLIRDSAECVCDCVSLLSVYCPPYAASTVISWLIRMRASSSLYMPYLAVRPCHHYADS